MTDSQLIPRPNPRIVAGDGTTTLTYALETHPAPLTASLPGEPQILGTLGLVITNPLPTPVGVTAVGLTVRMGTAGADLGTTTDGVGYAVSDPVNWAVSPPSSPVTSGTATWVLAPLGGEAVDLAPGASIVVELIQIPINQAVGTTTLAIAERREDGSGSTSFDITKFPHGFFFEGLIATVPSGSAHVPAAQVANGTPVTLLWSSSVTAAPAFTVLYATNQGQQTGTVAVAGQWTSPALARDTVFVVQVRITGEGGETLTFALATGVSVQNPDIVASTVSVANTLGVAGAAALGSVSVSGNASAGSLGVSGMATLSGGVTVAGSASAQSLKVAASIDTGQLSVERAWLKQVFAPYVTVSAQLRCMIDNPGTPLRIDAAGGQFATAYIATGDGPAFFAQNNSASMHTMYLRNAGGPTASALFASVGHADGWGIVTDGRVGSTSGCAHFTQVPTQSGPRAATSPLSLQVEVQASGTARLSGGSVYIAFDDAFADLVVPDAGYRVVLTPVGRCAAVCVAAKEARGFRVESPDAEVEVDWFVVAAKRSGLLSAERHEMPIEFPDVHATPRVQGPTDLQEPRGSSRDMDSSPTHPGDRS